MTPSETDIKDETAEAPAAPQVEAPEETPEAAAPEAPAEAPAAEAPAEAVGEAPAAEASASEAPAAETPAAGDAPAGEAVKEDAVAAEAPAPAEAAPAPDAPAPAAAREARPPRRNRQADRRKQLEELSRSTAAHLGREPDRRIVEKAIVAAGGPDAVREFLATPQESREGKPLGWRIACLREARRHEAGGTTEEGWVTLSAVPVRQIRGALDRAVIEDGGRISFRDEAPPRQGRGGGGRGRGDRRPGGRDERAVADQFMEGGVASFGGESSKKKNPFAALSGLLEDDEKK